MIENSSNVFFLLSTWTFIDSTGSRFCLPLQFVGFPFLHSNSGRVVATRQSILTEIADDTSAESWLRRWSERNAGQMRNGIERKEVEISEVVDEAGVGPRTMHSPPQLKLAFEANYRFGNSSLIELTIGSEVRQRANGKRKMYKPIMTSKVLLPAMGRKRFWVQPYALFIFFRSVQLSVKHLPIFSLAFYPKNDILPWQLSFWSLLASPMIISGSSVQHLTLPGVNINDNDESTCGQSTQANKITI